METNEEEVRVFVGSHIVLGCLGLPRLRLCYRPILRIPILTKISRDRMYKLRNHLHFVNNNDVADNVKGGNRLWKVQPILDQFRSACTKIPHPREMCIDELIIPFSGNTILRQYVPGKPNPVGLKVFVLASHDGQVLDFVIYQGECT